MWQVPQSRFHQESRESSLVKGNIHTNLTAMTTEDDVEKPPSRQTIITFRLSSPRKLSWILASSLSPHRDFKSNVLALPLFNDTIVDKRVVSGKAQRVSDTE